MGKCTFRCSIRDGDYTCCCECKDFQKCLEHDKSSESIASHCCDEILEGVVGESDYKKCSFYEN